MSKVVEFPQTPRVRVSNGIDLATDKNTYVFELVDGTGRNVIADHTDIEKVAALAAELLTDGIDVGWDRLEASADD